MKKSILFLTVIAIVFLSGSARAQYYDNYVINDAPSFIVLNTVNKSIRDKDAELLKNNMVREIFIKDKNNKPVRKMLINNFGYIEDYYTYNAETEAIKTHWRLGYSADNILTAASLREGRLRVNYILSYENDRLASIHVDSAGAESQHDFAYSPEGRIIKTTRLDLQRDTISSVSYYNYDSKGRLINVTDESKKIFLFEINYDNNSFRISRDGLSGKEFELDDNRIAKISYTADVKEAEGKKVNIFKTTEKFIYDSRGLVSEVYMKTNESGKESEKYEYSFYE